MIYPILFNRFKHHLPTVRAALQRMNRSEIEFNLKQIGESVMDLYVGDLPVETIFESIQNQLIPLNIYEPTLYESFLKSNQNHFKLTLDDNSVWVLLMGNDLKQFVHIHPARYSPHSIRVKANSWKTVIAAQAFLDTEKSIDLNYLNQIRQELNLSPLKNIHSASALMALFELFE